MTHFGSYTDVITTKNHEQALVRRSRRITDGKTPLSFPVPVRQEKNKENMEELKEEKEAQTRQPEVDELCSLFETTFAISNESLKVEHKETRRVSPMPKLGRFTSFTEYDYSAPKFFQRCESHARLLSPTKRSTRNVERKR